MRKSGDVVKGADVAKGGDLEMLEADEEEEAAGGPDAPAAGANPDVLLDGFQAPKVG